MNHSDKGQSIAVSTEKAKSGLAAERFRELHQQSGGVLEQSLSETNVVKLADAVDFNQELLLWTKPSAVGREVELVKAAASELEFGALSLVLGHYRHAFKSMRLVLELTLQAVFLSGNEVILRQWLSNEKDTEWGGIVHDKDGIFSPKFAGAFFPALDNHVKNYGGMAVKLYRECSECVHGNVPKHIPLPREFIFDQSTFDLWHAKGKVLRLVVHFTLAMRYFHDLTADEKAILQPCFSHLKHVKEITAALETGAKQ